MSMDKFSVTACLLRRKCWDCLTQFSTVDFSIRGALGAHLSSQLDRGGGHFSPALWIDDFQAMGAHLTSSVVSLHDGKCTVGPACSTCLCLFLVACCLLLARFKGRGV